MVGVELIDLSADDGDDASVNGVNWHVTKHVGVLNDASDGKKMTMSNVFDLLCHR